MDTVCIHCPTCMDRQDHRVGPGGLYCLICGNLNPNARERKEKQREPISGNKTDRLSAILPLDVALGAGLDG